MKNKKGLIELFNKQLNSNQFDLRQCVAHYTMSRIFSCLSTPLIVSGSILGFFGIFGFVMENIIFPYDSVQEDFLNRMGLRGICMLLIVSAVCVFFGVWMRKKEFGSALLSVAQRWFRLKKMMRKYDIGFNHDTAEDVAFSVESALRSWAATTLLLERQGFVRKRSLVRQKFADLHKEAGEMGFSVSPQVEFFKGFGDVRVNTRINLQALKS